MSTTDTAAAATAATALQHMPDRPGFSTRIRSIVADVVLWAFVLACLGFILFDIAVALKHKEIVERVKARIASGAPAQTQPATADEQPSGFIFAIAPMDSQNRGIMAYREKHPDALLGFVIAGAVIGLLLNLLNLSFVSRAYGFGRRPDGPRPPFFRSPPAITGSLVLVIILVTGWFVTQIEVIKALDAKRITYMSGMIARFFNVFGLEKVDTFTVPTDVPVPRFAMPPIEADWRLSEWPAAGAGGHRDWVFEVPVAGTYVTASGITIIGDAKVTLGKGQLPADFPPVEVNAADQARHVPIGVDLPLAVAGLSPTDTFATLPDGVRGPLIRPQVWQRVSFFRTRDAGNYTFTNRADGTDGPVLTISAVADAPVTTDAATGEITAVTTDAAGHPVVPLNVVVPLTVLGLDPAWELTAAPAGVTRVIETSVCFVASVAGRYEINQPKQIGYDEHLLPGSRASIIVMPGAPVSGRDAATREIQLLTASPAWASVQEPPRAWARFDRAIPSMIETVFLALMATVLAVPIAFVISFLGAQNLMRKSFLGTLIYFCVRTFLNLIRSIEPLCWAIIFGVWVGVGTFAGVLALMVHTIASLAKLYSEQIESIETGPVEAITATGASSLRVIRHAVVPQIIPTFISFTMYRWDINVRMAPILGFVGGGGIGMILQQHFNQGQWEEVGVIILLITIVVAAMDLASAKIRAKLT